MGLGTEGNDKSFQLKVEDDWEGMMSFRLKRFERVDGEANC
jgi:hypothetical protein